MTRASSTTWAFVKAHPNERDVDALVQAHTHDLPRLMRTISHLAVERVRSQAAHLFANAFLFRSGGKKGDDDA